MKYTRGYKSKNVEYRGSSRKGGAAAGVGGLGIIGVIIAMLLGGGGGGGGGGLGDLLGGATSGNASTQSADAPLPESNSFLEFTFDHVQTFWGDLFPEGQYPEAKFIIFTEAVNTGGCGQATAAVGPFYCPADQQVYLDQAFLSELQQRFGAPGDFAQAYVIAHEVGHHIQNVSGISTSVREQQNGQSQARVNELSVGLELQADCLAGVWGNYANSPEGGQILERGDIQEGLAAAQAVGDDRINPGASPESWTHGSAADREKWFLVGFESGDPQLCNSAG